jgi:hypothetical protein
VSERGIFENDLGDCEVVGDRKSERKKKTTK